ncbi:hypothetical protein D6C97_09732 [Aureobasidium pullulans]|nr:hypothetical protein D6C97_09732 [Aureobasidium pullulans]
MCVASSRIEDPANQVLPRFYSAVQSVLVCILQCLLRRRFSHAYHERFTSISDIVQEICGFPRIWFDRGFLDLCCCYFGAWCNGWLWASLIVLSATMDGRLGDSLGVGGCGGIMFASTAGMGIYGRQDRSYGASMGRVMKVRRLLSLEAPGRSGTGTDNMFIFAGKYI